MTTSPLSPDPNTVTTWSTPEMPRRTRCEPSLRRNEQSTASSVTLNWLCPWRGPSQGVQMRTSVKYRTTDVGIPRTTSFVLDSVSPAAGIVPDTCQSVELGASLMRDSTSNSEDKFSRYFPSWPLAEDWAEYDDDHCERACSGCLVCSVAARTGVSLGAKTNSPSVIPRCCSFTHCHWALGPLRYRTVNFAWPPCAGRASSSVNTHR